MGTNKNAALKLHKRYIKNTQREAIIANAQSFLCALTHVVGKGISSKARKVYINTRALKHIYDKRPAQEYDFLLVNLEKILKFPDEIYRNRDGKRSDFCFVKKFPTSPEHYSCFLELTETKGEQIFEVATSFRLSKASYLNNYKLLWSKEDGTSPS